MGDDDDAIEARPNDAHEEQDPLDQSVRMERMRTIVAQTPGAAVFEDGMKVPGQTHYLNADFDLSLRPRPGGLARRLDRQVRELSVQLVAGQVELSQARETPQILRRRARQFVPRQPKNLERARERRDGAATGSAHSVNRWNVGRRVELKCFRTQFA